MLCSLFGDDEEGYVTCSESDAFLGKRNGNPLSVSPPRPRLDCNMAGIENQGATCYLNSLLQTLLYTPEFREALFQIPKEELGSLEDRDKPGSKVRVIPLQLQRLFTRLLLADKQSVSTRELTDSFGWNGNEQHQQHDVQELSRILFSAISDSLAGTSGQNLITNLYHGIIDNQITCSECGTCSGREEDFLDLALTISGYDGLESTLSRYYQETESLDGGNQYQCGKCQKLVDAKKGARLKKLPPILTVSLLRFSYDFYKMERYKEVGEFAFPLELDMAPYMDKVGINRDDEVYELFSVVIHQGSAHGGHYHAYIRDIDNLGTWCSPEKIHLEPSKENQQAAVQKLDTPFELLEAILLDHENKAISADKLSMAIISQTGKSWKKIFGKYGQLTKFIKKHDDVFIFNESKSTIQLKKGYSISNKISDRPIETSQPSASKDLPNDSPPTNGLPKPGNCWYDYNDSRVSPITVKSLESQFKGKESAYMLFYRRKNLKRPEEGLLMFF
ncbi:hypothetical protein LOTGIDRAFT_220780 [Lottia gigantea]|uniref:Ubiquitin carboxyl-terminal hydrolase n=1 Tax=Lottia gigantea TaxID=225164 RepID=V3Z646_LOTGI|nr:hypothetical protein LOTGIDRAFT_220780 [Lottia gigantea]ESO86253.1 hypothetical protein LOTGIDRAFT_220780 [Lottia gigantea]